MKYLIVFSTLILLFSCDNELELTADWRNIPVVYGILNSTSEVQYIRVEKAFLDPETNAFTLAKNTDSIYYSNALVQLERPSQNATLTLEKVDGTKEGFIREEGIFATNPNFLYKIDLQGEIPFENGEMVRLLISDASDQLLASAETTIVESFELVGGQPGDQINFSDYERPIRLSWRTEGTAAIYDVSFIINYEESVEGSSSEFVSKSLEWKVATNLLRESQSSDRTGIQISGEEFYVFLDGALESGNNRIRRFRDLDFVVTAGGSELSEYIRVRQSNTGITSSQVVPTFSNIENGLGILSSTASTRKEGIKLTSPSLDSLAEGFYTRDLNFN